jgi:ABC-type transport system involved in multi-copper enzyme maturation permease subunit
MRALIAVSHNAFTEAIRQPIFIVLLLAVLLLLVLNPAVTARHTISSTGDEFNQLLVDLGLSMILVAGLLLAAFIAAGVLAREIDNRTVLTVISKPVSRPVFLVGKYLGVLAAVALGCWIWTLVFLFTVRHGVLFTVREPYHWPVICCGVAAALASVCVALWTNYFYRWVFGATLAAVLAVTLPIAYAIALPYDHGWARQPLSTDLDADFQQLLIALLLVFEALAVIVAIAIAAATRLRQTATLVVCGGLSALGLASDYVLGRHVEAHWLARLLYSLPFNPQFHWTAEALAQGRPIPATYVGLVSAYSAMHVIAALAIGAALFQTREVG